MTKRVRSAQVPHSASRVPSGRAVPLSALTALLTAEFLWPSEGAMNGDGLHLTVLWLFGLSGTCVWLWRSGAGLPFSFRSLAGAGWAERLLTAGVVLLPTGIWLSTAGVFFREGDRRAALNLALTWTGIAAAWMWSRLAAWDPVGREFVMRLTVSLGVGLAAFGIWQSHTFYASESEAYLRKRAVLDETPHTPEAAQIRLEFLRSGVPLEGPARKQFEQRLLNSTEPFGPFALANTFAGVLAVSLMLLAGRMLPLFSASAFWWQRAFVVAAAAVTAWCLVLTKSRTAWVAVVASAAALAVGQVVHRREGRFVRLLMRGGFVSALGTAVLLAGVFWTGVLDREVLTEAPRSLQFRLHYWVGTGGVIREFPWLGPGPGNFRQVYLRHRLVDSSEEILDPHNIFLDAWCSGGLPGLAGLLCLTGALFLSWRRPDPPVLMAGARGMSLIPGLAAGCVIHLAWMWFRGQTLGTSDGMLLASVGLAAVVSAGLKRLPMDTLAVPAAATALCVHLLGAGGLQTPICGLLLLLLMSAAVARKPAESKTEAVPGAFFFGGTAAAAGALAVAAVWVGLIPVTAARLHEDLGRLALDRGDPRSAQRSLEAAVGADPLSVSARQQMVRAAAYGLMRPVRGDREQQRRRSLPDEKRQDILRICDELVAADRRRVGSLLARADIRYRLFRAAGYRSDLEGCLADLRQAAQWHPTSAAIQAQLARREREAGNRAAAAAAARTALDIEAVNRRWWHSDQFLPERDLEILQEIISEASDEDTQPIPGVGN